MLLLLAFPLLTIMPKDHTIPETAITNSEQALNADVEAGRFGGLLTALQASVDQYQLIKFIFSSRNMRLAMAIFLISTFRSISLRVLTQYTSFRFGWKLSKVS